MHPRRPRSDLLRIVPGRTHWRARLRLRDLFRRSRLYIRRWAEQERSATASECRAESNGGWNSGRHSTWLGRSVLRSIREGLGASWDRGAGDRRFVVGPAVASGHCAGNFSWLFLGVPDHRCHPYGQGHSGGRADSGSIAGLASTFGTGEKIETTNVPAAAAILIGLGVLFLVNTVFDFSLHRFWPIILIVLGVWLFAKHWGLLGGYRPYCVCEHCRTRKLMGPAILVTLGVLFLLDNVSGVEFHRTWPAILLVIGVVKLLQSNASSEGHIGPLPPVTPPGVTPSVPPPPAPPVPSQNPEQAASSGEVNHV